MAKDHLANCACYVQTLDPGTQFVLRWGAHNPACPIYRESGDYLDKMRDSEARAKLDPKYQCDHQGEPCDNERFCGTCGAGPLRQGFTVDGGQAYGCDAHQPEGYEYTDDGDDYWTEWDKEGNDCDCPAGCPCYTDGDQQEYTIAVTVNVERQYTVTARDAAQALAKYQAGQADLDESRSEMAEWEEQPQTAHTLYPDGHEIAWPGPAHGVETDELATLRAEVAEWRELFFYDGDQEPDQAPPTYTPTDDDDRADQARLAALQGDPWERVETCIECGKLFEPDRKGDDICADC
jgi:hypothetical protein